MKYNTAYRLQLGQLERPISCSRRQGVCYSITTRFSIDIRCEDGTGLLSREWSPVCGFIRAGRMAVAYFRLTDLTSHAGTGACNTIKLTSKSITLEHEPLAQRSWGFIGLGLQRECSSKFSTGAHSLHIPNAEYSIPKELSLAPGAIAWTGRTQSKRGQWPG